jgi:membrane protein implicated in regulation of membrane protease activity
MSFSEPILWWLIAGTLVAAEVASGTFYLLMLSVGAVAAALVAHAGLGFTAQLVAAALVGGGAVAAWHLRRTRQPKPPTQSNRDINLDIGSPVLVAAWGADGCTRVHYRGAEWSARYSGTDAPQAGAHVICAIEGSQLLLQRA